MGNEFPKCEGGCEKCAGEVKKVEVSGNGWKLPFTFWYCAAAVQYDRNNGFTVTVVE